MSPTESITLSKIAHARSGDKGNHANIGVIAYTAVGFEYLREQLSEQCVREFFDLLPIEKVERFELPHVHALNFVLHQALDGGASRSHRIDSQGKLLGPALLDMRLSRPDNLDQMTNPTDKRA